MWKETALLNDVTRSPSKRDQLCRLYPRAIDDDRPGIGRDQSDDKSQQRRLAASARTDENSCCALTERDRRWRQRNSRPIDLRDVVEGDEHIANQRRKSLARKLRDSSLPLPRTLRFVAWD